MASEKDHDHQWFELNRYLPYRPEDTDADVIFPEHPRDENGRIRKLDIKKWEAPDAHVYFTCSDPECDATKMVKIPKRDADRVREMLENGEMQPELLSQLPLGELFPALAEHQTKGSGAARIGGAE